VIATYDSIVAKGGLGPAIFPAFEKKCGCRVRTLASGDAGQMLTRLEIDAARGKPSAAIVLGIDQNLWARAKKRVEPWGDWRPEGFEKIARDLRVGKDGDGFLPFDYGIYSFIADTKALKEQKLEPPKSLGALLSPKWRRRVILEDPRTSTPGLGFVLYVARTRGAGAAGFWKSFRGQWLTLAPGWDGAYGLFLRGEAPLVWSYTTSQAYHREHGDSAHRYQAVIFEEGQPVQVEGAALVKGVSHDASRLRLAREFLEYLISPEVQKLVPEKNWMLPVRAGTPLPAAFRELPRPRKLLRPDQGKLESAQALKRWGAAIEGGAP
jgi:thiamine transport system substrate-binding protein